MAKAIHWPAVFRDEVLGEDTQTLRCALRLGNLYYQNQYWVDGEVVDIRVNHLKVRRALVQGALKQCPIQSLTVDDFNAQKRDLKNQTAVIRFLQETYGEPVNPETLVTVVYYKNLPVVPDEIESPDDTRPE